MILIPHIVRIKIKLRYFFRHREQNSVLALTPSDIPPAFPPSNIFPKFYSIKILLLLPPPFSFPSSPLPMASKA